MSRALVTGGRGGIGRAIADAYDGDVVVLDLPEFDVGAVDAWASLEGDFDAAFLNAGIGIGYEDVAELPDDELDRIVRANFLGVVYGTRECARRLMPNGGSIVATASLAGLTGMPFDPLYTATKHAVVGFVRGAAPGLLARGIRLNALCPGFTDTPIVEDELRGRLPVPLMEPSFVAGAAMRALHDEEVGRAWIVQPNRIEPFRYPGMPGPRAGSDGGEAAGGRPPGGAAGARRRRSRRRPAPRSAAGGGRGMTRRRGWGETPPPDPHIWNTLGYRGDVPPRVAEGGPARPGFGGSAADASSPTVIEWDATPEFCFHDGSGGFIVHGGMVTTLLDTAMGGACWATLGEDESFLTADLRAEFLRAARPGTLRAVGRVVQRNRRVAFCSADLFQDGELLATARCTQIIRSE